MESHQNTDEKSVQDRRTVNILGRHKELDIILYKKPIDCDQKPIEWFRAGQKLLPFKTIICFLVHMTSYITEFHKKAASNSKYYQEEDIFWYCYEDKDFLKVIYGNFTGLESHKSLSF